MILRNLPNALSLVRCVLIIPFIVFFAQSDYQSAFYIFLAAGFTDAIDGWLARSFNWQSAFGSFVDPIADKLLITSSFLALAYTGALPWGLVILVFLRDFTISMGVLAWYGLMHKPLEFEPTYLSKINTVMQLSLVTFFLFEQAFHKSSPVFGHVLLIITVLTTSWSYIDYVWTWGKKAWASNTRTN